MATPASSDAQLIATSGPRSRAWILISDCPALSVPAWVPSSRGKGGCKLSYHVHGDVASDELGGMVSVGEHSHIAKCKVAGGWTTYADAESLFCA